jgi:glycosyltransferase involved in cell wall biosynthesis
MPRVSVVVVFLNTEAYIEEAIESVLVQTHRDWELLLVDDGAVDGSSAHARRYTARYPDRVKYFEHAGHANRGASAARNLGLRHASGEYVAFLDSDDVWLPHKLARQVEILDGVPAAGMVYGATEYWYSWTGRVEDAARDTVKDLGVRPGVAWPPTLLTSFLDGRAPTPSCSNVMIRRSVMDAVRGFEESFRSLYTDQVFFAKVCLTTPVFVAAECWDRYRQRTDSSYSGARGTAARERARTVYLTWLEQFLTDRAVESPDVWRALRDKQARHHRPAANGLVNRAWRGARAALRRALA